MRNKFLLLIVCASFLMLSNDAMIGQQGVLAPKKQTPIASTEQVNLDDEHEACCTPGHVHDENCNHDHDFESIIYTPVPFIPVYQDNTPITPRRGVVSNPTPDFFQRDTIHGPKDVSTVFGAGESSVISGTRVKWPFDFTTPTTPDDTTGVGSTPPLPTTDPKHIGRPLLIGSDYTKNAVIGIYDNNGEASGALREVMFYQQGHGDKAGLSRPDTVNKLSFTPSVANCGPTTNSFNAATELLPLAQQAQSNPPQLAQRATTLSYDPLHDVMIQGIGSGTPPAASLPPINGATFLGYTGLGASLGALSTAAPTYYFANTAAGAFFWPYKHPDPDSLIYYVPVYNHHKPGWAAWDKFVFYGALADSLYTSTRDATSFDDGKSLLIAIPQKAPALNVYQTYLTNSAEYIRPTTILLSDRNSFDYVTVGNVEWYAAYMDGKVYHTVDTLFHVMDPGGCCHYSGWVSYFRDDVRFDTIGTVGSGRYVDAAVRLLDDADVCVTRDITDNTSSKFSINTDGTILATGSAVQNYTDALLILPGLDNWQGERSNFRLKIGGNADILHTQDSSYYSGTTPLDDGFLYSDANHGTGPGDPFQTVQSPGIWLGSGQANSTFIEVSGLKNEDFYVHPREFVLIDTDPSKPDTALRPYIATNASVYGVHGNYNGQNDIHTRSIAATFPANAGFEADYDTTSIIEFGPLTANQSYFNIYSMGMLKNFRSECVSTNDSLTIGTISTIGTNAGLEKAPYFEFTEYNKPIYILNDGDGSGCSNPASYHFAGIRFNGAGTDNINNAIANAAGGGDLHVQAQSFVSFYGEPLMFDVTAHDNNISILSDSNYIYVEGGVTFINQDTANFTMWARGASDGRRGAVNMNISNTEKGSGGIQIDGPIYMETNTTGLIMFRSEYDDVIFKDDFEFLSELSDAESGELMIQAGHDIQIYGAADLVHGGPHSMLFEAHNTAYFKDFTVKMRSNGLGTGSSTPGYMEHGDLIIKAGYPFFHDNSHVDHPLEWNAPSFCFTPGYDDRREAGISATGHPGGDIWFNGEVDIAVTPDASDYSNVIVRAYNSIYVDGLFNLSYETLDATASIHDSIITYAETGNYEAMDVLGTPEVQYDFKDDETIWFLLQAGNQLGLPCAPSKPCVTNNEWHGNILFGLDKTFTINHDGRGPTLISAARDIENQVGAEFMFNYTNPDLDATDPMMVTAGRHIETHAPWTFDFTAAGNDISNNITMQAGHLMNGCNYDLCKVFEEPSNVRWTAYSPVTPPATTKYNEFSEDGNGQGSIFLFDAVTFNYEGKGDILMTALNGNIESDPYLHGGNNGYPGTAPITFNHSGSEGDVTMEAIDIKLHGILEYNSTPAGNKNGNFTMHAFDSILTRNISYENLTDAGSVEITTDKIKPGTSAYCDVLMQGHIVLGYGANCDITSTTDDVLKFDFTGNLNTTGANLLIKAGWLGYDLNTRTGKGASSFLFQNHPNDWGKGYGGNITFDHMQITMGLGDGTLGGYTEISTPNGNIWGKDSLSFRGINGNLYVDAGLGSLEDTIHAVRWGSRFPNAASENMLNTSVPLTCGENLEWRTGNIMIKGGSIDFTDYISSTPQPGTGNATFRTREGYIDIYDRFDASNMTGHLMFYAGTNTPYSIPNQWGDVSLRDFSYTTNANSGSVYIGADDNIMLNYGFSNGNEMAYNICPTPGLYDGIAAGIIHTTGNPFYTNNYGTPNLCWASFDVNTNGYLWYRDNAFWNNYHLMFRGCESKDLSCQPSTCSTVAGECKTIDNGARPLVFDFSQSSTGGLAVVANNYIDVFTDFHYDGGAGSGIHPVPGTTTLRSEQVAGYGLFMKSVFDGVTPAEDRRNTCYGCDDTDPAHAIWPYIAFHDNAYIYPEKQKAVIEAPVVEFFGHADLDVDYNKGVNSSLTTKADSLIFHDSVIFDGERTKLLFDIFTTDPVKRAQNAMRLGVVNDVDRDNYLPFGPAIAMNDRRLPVIELGFQRCTPPPYAPNLAPNRLSESGGEPTPHVGGHIIVAFKHDLAMPIFNTIVANHARISFVHDYFDQVKGNPWGHAYFRTDLLRIRNKVEFYTDPDNTVGINGNFKMSSNEQIATLIESGIYPKHVHLEPGSELSIPGEDSLNIIQETTIGGYGEAHENVHVQAYGTIAPGYASLMECDCQSGCNQGSMKIHNLYMEKDAILRISMGKKDGHCEFNPMTGRYDLNCTQTDTLIVQDSIFLFGKVTMRVLQETDHIEPGCYLFMTYNELNASPEYLHNLHLENPTIDGYNFYIDYLSEPGFVYLCITAQDDPIIQRYVNIHSIEGVTTSPTADIYHFVRGHEDYVFTATYNDKTADPFETFAVGYYSGRTQVLAPRYLLDGVYEYTIRQVVEPWDVYFNPEVRIDPQTGNVGIANQKVWTFKNTLFVNVDKADIVSIYNITGVLFQKLEIPAGLNKLTLEKGVYLVTLKDGTVYKIIIN